MKKITYIILAAAAGCLLSCNKFLDEMPDNRTEIDTPEKIAQILVSAYSEGLPNTYLELMTDNVTDGGKNISVGYDRFAEAYLFEENFTTTGNDSPSDTWAKCYGAIASANYALEAIETIETTEDLSPHKGEALITRAYNHFILANTFCQAYTPATASKELGIPYITEPETTVYVIGDRETLDKTYAKIAADIEEGLPLIDDNLYTQPKYHFNKRAANAFAAQFYLYYCNYERAAECADAAIGVDPTSLMRDWTLFTGTSSSEYTSAYNSSSEIANLMNQGYYSVGNRAKNYRFFMNLSLLNETMRSYGLLGSYLTNYNHIYSVSSRSYFFPKQVEYFMYTDASAGIGYPYQVQVVFCTEKSIIDRAEAYVMMGDYESAARDLNYFYTTATSTTVNLSVDYYSSYYETCGDKFRKEMAPDFTVEEGTQLNMLHAVLHARRIVTAHEGTRLQDLKRFGIAFTHEVDGDTDIVLEPYDRRLVVQIPELVVSAGLEANPR